MFNALFILLCSLSTFNGGNAGTMVPVPGDSIRNESVLYVFAGSDWCVKCRRLEENVLSDSVFLSALDSGRVRIEILDFPQRKILSPETVSYNQSMSEKLGFSGDFPTIVIYSARNNKYSTILYKNEDPAQFSLILFNELNKLNE